MIRARYHVNTLWKLTLVSACAAMVVLWPNWRVALQSLGYYQEEGRMTGGGKCTATDLVTGEVVAVTHGFELHCDINDLPNNLEINWKDAAGTEQRFHLEELTSATCTDDPAIDQKPPSAPFDTFIGTGTGSFNGQPDYTISFTFVDAGEPGTKDTARYLITAPDGTTIVLDVSTKHLTFGNHQAHKN